MISDVSHTLVMDSQVMLEIRCPPAGSVSLLALLLPGLLWLLSGCGGQSSGTVPVQGQVTFDGLPVPGMRIFFVPERGRASSGVTAEDGTFELFYKRDLAGVQPGRHQVTMNWAPSEEEGGQPQPVIRDVLKYFEVHGPITVDILPSQRDLKIELPQE